MRSSLLASDRVCIYDPIAVTAHRHMTNRNNLKHFKEYCFANDSTTDPVYTCPSVYLTLEYGKMRFSMPTKLPIADVASEI
jgi:hypothetical protein